jgi:host factor-I protein
MKVKINVQDQFLNQLRKERAKIDVVFLNGSSVTGTIKSFDNFSIVIEADKFYLIYKHAISNILIDKAVRLGFYQQQERGEHRSDYRSDPRDPRGDQGGK